MCGALAQSALLHFTSQVLGRQQEPRQSSTSTASVLNLYNNLLCDLSICLDDNLVHFLRGFDRLDLVVNPVELLKRATLGFNAVFAICQ